LAEKNEKEVELHFEGENLLLKPDVYKPLFTSFTHLFRNAIDHGLESSEERRYSDKTEVGNIIVRADSKDGWLYLKISDDGRGIDLGAIEQKARSKKLLSDHALESISEAELMMLIFEDGFSSLDSCSKYSGRGVGLSAVREAVEKLGGNISVASESGKYTQFNIEVPFYSIDVNS